MAMSLFWAGARTIGVLQPSSLPAHRATWESAWKAVSSDFWFAGNSIRQVVIDEKDSMYATNKQ